MNHYTTHLGYEHPARPIMHSTIDPSVAPSVFTLRDEDGTDLVEVEVETKVDE